MHSHIKENIHKYIKYVKKCGNLIMYKYLHNNDLHNKSNNNNNIDDIDYPYKQVCNKKCNYYIDCEILKKSNLSSINKLIDIIIYNNTNIINSTLTIYDDENECLSYLLITKKNRFYQTECIQACIKHIEKNVNQI